ncbi:MAG: HAD family hydrolase [Rubripirellula sp.]
MRVLLFDIDGTLLVTDDGGKTALEAALADEFELSAVDVAISFAGRTDRSILRELLERNRLDASEPNQNRLARRYSAYLPKILAQRGGEILPGINELLEKIAAQDNFLCYVMTGNLRETATHKLNHFGLTRYFQGVFGGDHDSARDDLARRTAADLRDRHGEQQLGEVIVIGDTPHDIRCGHAIGARVVAVCTGSYGRSALEAEKPAAVLDDFADATAIHDLLSAP